MERDARVRTNGDVRAVRVSVRRIHEAKLARPIFLVSFHPDGRAAARARPQRPAHVSPAGGRKGRALQLEEELRTARSDLQSTTEELQTSKEETQSLNEELQTVNAELTIKVHNLEESNDARPGRGTRIVASTPVASAASRSGLQAEGA